MLSFDAVTTYADRHWDQYAGRCLETFSQHWTEIDLHAFTDNQLEFQSDWLSAFKVRHARRPTTNYRFDAIRFAHKVAAIELQYKYGSADCLVWIDADCVTHAHVDAIWLSGLLGNADFGYLRRLKKYPECGFMLMRRCPSMDRFVSSLVDLYRTDNLFRLSEWHDSFAIEHVRHEAGIVCTSLSGKAENTGHPLVNGPLGERLDHLKGKRKIVGRSRRSDLICSRSEEYWVG